MIEKTNRDKGIKLNNSVHKIFRKFHKSFQNLNRFLSFSFVTNFISFIKPCEVSFDILHHNFVCKSDESNLEECQKEKNVIPRKHYFDYIATTIQK